jgi:ubiquinone/menaquinone biosynthesis C-methylase UbiE
VSRFDQIAKEWDTNPQRVESASKFADFVMSSINKDISNFEVLDYGTGSGLVAFCLKDSVKSVVGLDNSKGMLDTLKSKINNLSISNVSCDFHDINKESVKENSFDLIVTNMTMHHIKDYASFISKLHSSLKSGGYLFIADLESEDGTFHGDNTGVEHFGFKLKEIESIYQKTGFKDVSVEVYDKINKPNKTYNIFVSRGTKL